MRTLVVLSEAIRDLAAADKTLREHELGNAGAMEVRTSVLQCVAEVAVCCVAVCCSELSSTNSAVLALCR